MGSLYNWKCTKPKCNTTVGPVSGGFDRGFTTQTQTRICTVCKQVSDYNVGVVSDPTHRMFDQTELESHANPEPKCFSCSGETVAWDQQCPVCGAPMSMDFSGPIMLWD